MELTPTFPIGSVTDCSIDSEAEFMAPSRLCRREMVPTEINYDTVLVPMAESVLQDTPERGYGAAYLDVFLEDTPPGQVKSFAGVTDFDHCALVYAKAGAIKASNHHIKPVGKIVSVQQVHLYYEEVHPSNCLSDEQLRERLRFAQNTGFVLIGPDECFAVLTTRDGVDYTFCDVYENNLDGIVRNLAGYYAEGLEVRLGVKRISEMDASETDRAMSKVGGDLLWWVRPGMPVNKEQVRRMTESYRLLEEHRPTAPLERRASGATIKRWFISNGSTESVRELVKNAEGWRRYSTYQDAWYFGVWVNPKSFEFLTYAEQDVTHVVCENETQFQLEMADLARCYGHSRSPSMIAYGESEVTVAFDSLTFLKGNVEALQFTHPVPKPEGQGELNIPLFASLKLDHPAVTGIKNGERIELSSENFELDLFNPIAFEGPHRAELSKVDGNLQIFLFMADGCEYETEVKPHSMN